MNQRIDSSDVEDGVLTGAAILALLTLSSAFLPLGFTRWSMAALIMIWSFLQFRSREGTRTALGIAISGGISTAALVAVLDPMKDSATPGEIVLGFALFGVCLGLGTSLLRDDPPVPTLRQYKDWLEVAVLIGLGFGFISLPFAPFTDAADASSRATFGAAIFGAALMGSVRLGISLGSPVRHRFFQRPTRA